MKLPARLQSKYVVFATAYIVLLSVLSFNVTRAVFTASATSTNNSFTAAEEFPDTPPAINSGDVVINEIGWAGFTSNSDDEFIELRNTTASSITVTGWKITGAGSGATDVVLPSATISANGFFLLANFEESNSSISATPDHIAASISLLNDGEQLILKTSTDSVIDTANVTGDWLAGINTPPKQSMERKDTPGDGTQVDNWHSSTGQINLDVGVTDFATPKAANSSGI